jgi:serine/threonine protein phosphatase PrpC
LLRSIKKY